MGHSIAKNYDVVHVKPKSVKEEATVISSEEELNALLESFFFEGKEERAAKAREIAIANIKAGKGTAALRKRLAAQHGVHHITGEPLTTGGGEKPAAKHDDDDYYMHHGEKIHSSEVDAAKAKHKRRKLSTKAALDMIVNTRRMAAAKHATSSAVGGGSGAANVSPLDKAMQKVSDKPKKGAGASPAELDAEKREKKAAEKKVKTDDPKKLSGKPKLEEGLLGTIGKTIRSVTATKNPVKKRYYSAGRKSGGNYVANRALPIKPLKNVREELNTDMLDKHDGQKEKGKEKKVNQKDSKKTSKLKYKYHKRTATGEKTHKVEWNPEISQGKA